MPRVRWHHSMRPARRPHGTSPACRVVRLLIDSRAQTDASQIHSYSAGVILSHLSASALSTQTCVPFFRDFLTSTHLTPPLPLSLFKARLLVLGRLLRSSRRVCTSTTFDFSPPDQYRTPSRIRHKLLQCLRRREARCRAAQSKRPRHRMYIMQVASQRG